jgi:catechol 2,3-dioxygenase-like lactoylglutathione lyase family enzyme
MLTVRDPESTAAALGAAGMQVGPPVEGLISGAKSVLVTDPDGVVIELAEGADDGDVVGALFSGIRIAAIDAVATGKFLTAIGFIEMEAPTSMSLTAQQFTPAGSSDSADCTVAQYGLAEDSNQFRLTVVQHPDTANTPVPWGGNRQGLYRCALRVESVEEALASVPGFVERCGDPVWCPLPGTKIEGLYIAFLRSPDGVVFEFVERPLKYFSR